MHASIGWPGIPAANCTEVGGEEGRRGPCGEDRGAMNVGVELAGDSSAPRRIRLGLLTVPVLCALVMAGAIWQVAASRSALRDRVLDEELPQEGST
jgi:hypothetical protein